MEDIKLENAGAFLKHLIEKDDEIQYISGTKYFLENKKNKGILFSKTRFILGNIENIKSPEYLNYEDGGDNYKGASALRH